MSAFLYIPRLLTACFAAGLILAACTAVSKPEGTNDSEQSAVTPESSAVTPEPAAAAPEPTPMPAVSLPDLGPAPDISNEVWLNTEELLNLEALRGKVVLVEFWTFG